MKETHEEEWSYIPVGGPLPLPDQPITAFGAAANLVHPATGETVAGSREQYLLNCWYRAVTQRSKDEREQSKVRQCDRR